MCVFAPVVAQLRTGENTQDFYFFQMQSRAQKQNTFKIKRKKHSVLTAYYISLPRRQLQRYAPLSKEIANYKDVLNECLFKYLNRNNVVLVSRSTKTTTDMDRSAAQFSVWSREASGVNQGQQYQARICYVMQKRPKVKWDAVLLGGGGPKSSYTVQNGRYHFIAVYAKVADYRNRVRIVSN